MASKRLAIGAAALALAIIAGGLGAWYFARRWPLGPMTVLMGSARARSGSYGSAVRQTAASLGAPEWYVRARVPTITYSAPCWEERTNPLVWVNRICGYVGGGILTVIPFTAPAGAAVLTAAASIDAALPRKVVRPCR